MQSHNSHSSPEVAIFWDYENCHASSQVSGYEVVGSIRNVAHRFGPVKYFKAYMEVPEQDTFRSLSLRSELQSSGVSLTDCPHNGRKNVADQMIIVDMLAYAMDHPAPATLILISGDRDFAYPVSILRLRQYDVVVVSLPLPGAHPSLKRQASVWLDWNREVLGITNPSSSLEATEESSTTRRNSFTFQSPSARRSSYLPTPETPSFRAFQLPQKNDTVVGTNKGPSFFGDLNSKVVSPETLEAEDVSLPQIPKAEPMLASSELAYRPPFCKERYKSQQYIPVPPLPEQINVRAVKSPIASPLGAQVVDNGAEAVPISAESPVAASGPCSSIPEARQAVLSALTPAQPTGLEDATTVLGKHPHSPSLCAERNDDPQTEADILLSGSVSAKENKASDTLETIPAPALPLVTPVHLGDSTVPPAEFVVPPVVPNQVNDILTEADSEKFMKHVLPAFRPLVTVLLKHAAKGVRQPLRSVVGYELAGLAQTVYQQAGVTNFSQLTALAERTKLIQMGGTGGNAWIALHRDFLTPADSRPNAAQSSSSSPGTPPPLYRTLVEVLRKYKSKGIPRPARSVVAVEIVAQDKQIYERAGVNRFRDYVALAEQAGVCVLGGTEALAWISIHPNWSAAT